MLKGKEKIFSGKAFDDSGALSQEAIKIIDSGALDFISKKFKKGTIDLNEEVLKGLTGIEVLNKAVSGTLQEVFSSFHSVAGGTTKGVSIVDKDLPWLIKL